MEDGKTSERENEQNVIFKSKIESIGDRPQQIYRSIKIEIRRL